VVQQEPAITFEDVSYRYPGSKRYVLKHLNLTIRRGEFVTVLGENGAGKSTFCKALNGVIPLSRGGRLRGHILVDGRDTQESTIAELAQKVGIVLEDPEAQLFTTTVLSEVAFGPENLGVDPDEILRRARWALEVVRLTGYEDHPPTALSGGQKQRLAIAAALTMRPAILVLDEATSQLDPVGTVEVFSVVRELNQRYGMTIVMATNKGEEVGQFCDRVLVLQQGELVAQGTPRQVFADTGLFQQVMVRAPQVSQLALYLAEQELPLADFPITLDEARREVVQLLAQSNGSGALSRQERAPRLRQGPRLRRGWVSAPPSSSPPPERGPGRSNGRQAAVVVDHLEYVYQPHGVRALKGVSFAIQRGEFVSIIGQNGAGKTTLLKNVVGLLLPTAGRVVVDGVDTRQTTVAELTTRVGFVSQNPDQQLFAQTVEEEVAFGPRNLGLAEDEVKRRVGLAIGMAGLEAFRQEFPPALAKGDRAKVVMASVLAMQPEIIILDEPTTGQDTKGSHQIMQIAQRLHAQGCTVLVVTHDVALVAEYAARTIVLGQGEILLDDATAAVFSQPEVLRRTHVTPPQITQLAQTLPRELGLPANALTVPQLGQPIVHQAGQRRRAPSRSRCKPAT